jgi:hypothetical protein
MHNTTLEPNVLLAISYDEQDFLSRNKFVNSGQRRRCFTESTKLIPSSCLIGWEASLRFLAQWALRNDFWCYRSCVTFSGKHFCHVSAKYLRNQDCRTLSLGQSHSIIDELFRESILRITDNQIHLHDMFFGSVSMQYLIRDCTFYYWKCFYLHWNMDLSHSKTDVFLYRKHSIADSKITNFQIQPSSQSPLFQCSYLRLSWIQMALAHLITSVLRLLIRSGINLQDIDLCDELKTKHL